MLSLCYRKRQRVVATSRPDSIGPSYQGRSTIDLWVAREKQLKAPQHTRISNRNSGDVLVNSIREKIETPELPDS